MGQESLYATVHSIVVNQINSKNGQIYFPFIYALFIFILINNLISMVPYSFALTSHFILTFALSFTVVLGATILGFQKHGLKFFSLSSPDLINNSYIKKSIKYFIRYLYKIFFFYRWLFNFILPYRYIWRY